jgi:hypothetical protein
MARRSPSPLSVELTLTLPQVAEEDPLVDRVAQGRRFASFSSIFNFDYLIFIIITYLHRDILQKMARMRTQMGIMMVTRRPKIDMYWEFLQTKKIK